MAKRIYIPAPKGQVKARPQLPTAPVVDPNVVMNATQFAATLKHTHEEIYSKLVVRLRATFHGTLAQWQTELEALKKAPA